MRHRCAWCRSEIASEDGIVPIGAISDGICPACLARYFPKLQRAPAAALPASAAGHAPTMEPGGAA